MLFREFGIGFFQVSLGYKRIYLILKILASRMPQALIQGERLHPAIKSLAIAVLSQMQ
jgi:hypothetical protein